MFSANGIELQTIKTHTNTRMEQVQQLVNTITKGIQEKKGRDITIIDLRKIEGAITAYFVICQASSPTQVDAIADSVEEQVRIKEQEKPTNVIGKDNCQWVAMDYIDVIVHIFLPEARSYYDLENLWKDAEQTDVPNID